MTTILPNPKPKNETHSYISHFFKENKLGTMLNQANIRKTAGFSPIFLLQFIFSFVLNGKNLYRMLDSDCTSDMPGKDTVHRFLNNPSYNWRKFLVLLSKNVIVTKLIALVSSDRERVLIIDDSLYSRARSKAVELLSLVHDHTTGQFVRGFRMLTLGWSDGNTFIPLAFSLLSSSKQKNRFQEINSRIDKRTVGYKRRQEALTKSTEAMFNLLADVNPLQLCAKTLLFDSWFAFPKVIKRVVCEYPLHVICMLKSMHRVYYTFEGEKYTLNQLYRKVRKKRGRAKILASVIVSIGTDDKGNDVLVRIVFVRDRNRSKKWLALLSTNLDLSEEEVIRLYGKRWDIECFFKVTKSHLRLAKECQSRHYDALVAHTTIVFTRYIMLAISSREEKDPKTIGQLFYLCCDEMENIRFTQALLMVIDLLKSTLSKEPVLSEEKVQSIIDELFDNLPSFLKKAFLCNEEIKASAS